jgi:hypothetical protein
MLTWNDIPINKPNEWLYIVTRHILNIGLCATNNITTDWTE